VIVALALGGATGWTAPASLTVATYNVQNYTATNRMVGEVYRPEYPKPEAEKAALRAVLRELDAEVLALQEVGGEAHLRELQRDLRREGLDYPYREVLVAADEVRCVAVLSRRPLARVERHEDLDFAYFGGRERVKRGMLEVEVATASGAVTIFVVHLKSRYTNRDDDPESARRRGAEATAARDRVLARFPEPGAADARFLVVGDFNDGPTSRAVRAFSRRGEREIAALLPAADSRGEAWTHHFKREDNYTRVDHVRVSAALRPWVLGDAARIADGAAVKAASDHRPVMVRLAWPGAASE
jgi:endonuclease/exonuclease/phosphatase family metal-dependent hydrolase